MILRHALIALVALPACGSSKPTSKHEPVSNSVAQKNQEVSQQTADDGEAKRYLEKLARNERVLWISAGSFTVGRAGPTPPTKCGCPKKCPVDEKLWLDHPVWNDVEIYVNDESRYQYTYESDGKTYKATAIGDLDCDGTPGIWTISGVGGPSDVAVTLTPPPQGMY